MHVWVTIVMRYTWAKIFWAQIFWVFAYIKEILCIETSLIDSNVSLPHIMIFLLISSFKSLIGCSGLERTDFEQFLLWEGMVVLKELILNSFYFGRVWWSWKDWFWRVSTLGGFGGLQRTDSEQFLLWGGCGGLERTYGRCTGKHWGHTRGCLNIWGCWGIRGHQGGLNACAYPNIWGCQLNVPKCITYMPLKKIGGVWTYGGVEMDSEALGTYKGVFEHMGVLGASG